VTGFRFASTSWVDAWVELMNADDRFRAEGQGWVGSIGCVINSDDSGGPPPIYMRLSGADGHWDAAQAGPAATLVEDVTVRLEGPRHTWRLVIDQDLNPIRAMVQGRLRVHGQLSALLRFHRAIVLMAQLAGDVDTLSESAD
jgi:putative sterol carrier protein